ncbi:hypothetical protein [Pseudonocardia dioxanivorans]|uniref:hypothetical protein n=1 Tax=Pseudonocardia dioxanivorans TaxID=240495 RepID=UPI00104669C8|nr:hypothetical protein [Pseudonocardia dioxanivorans]
MAEFLDRDVDELGQLLDRAAQQLELVQHSGLPVLQVGHLDLGGLFDLGALPVKVGQAPVTLGEEIVARDGGRGELFEQGVFPAPAGFLLGVEPVPRGGQPGEVLARGGTTTGPSRTRRGRLDHQDSSRRRTATRSR